MGFEDKYFKKLNFSQKQIEKYLNSALRDISIAKGSKIAEVKFQFTYNSLIKLGITLVACQGYKVNSRTGHHIKILEKMAEILKNRDILIYGNAMRKVRNTELYDGGICITNKQAGEFLDFLLKIVISVQKFIEKKFNTFLFDGLNLF